MATVLTSASYSMAAFLTSTSRSMASLLSLRGLRSLSALLPPPGTAGYHARPRRWGLGQPPPEDPERSWRTGPRFKARLYGRFGEASEVRPGVLWPSAEGLRKLLEEEREWFPPLQEMQQRLRERAEAKERERKEKEKLIAAHMAKMPQMVADWRREKRAARQKLNEEKARRERLMAEAKERFGQALDPRSPKFLEMVKDMEKEEKKQEKLLKKRLRAESHAATAALAATKTTT